MKDIIKKIKKTVVRIFKITKKVLIKDITISAISLIGIMLFVFLLIKIGFLRAIIAVFILEAILFFLLYIKRKKLPKTKKKTLYKKILIIILFGGIALMLLGSAFIGYVVVTAPKFDPSNMSRNESSLLYDSKGVVFAKLGLEKREEIVYNELPEVLIDAIVATEDSRFFEHNGFDLPRFIKATAGQLIGDDAGGASTITMQVSKNNYTSTVSSGFEGIKRKFTDIYISIFQIERNYTKEEILEFYVNQPYLGSGAYGVEQACQTYFGKSAKDINLSEAALIAGLFQAPNAYDPFLSPENAEKRRSTVLYLMERHGYITKEEREAANAISVESLLTTKAAGGQYQSFIDTVVEEVIKITGQDPYRVPMEVYTTMESDKQLHMNDIINGITFQWENDQVNAGIIATNTQTGAISAVGAGRNRVGQRQFNNATMIERQIGSTAKPLYDYGPGIEYQNWSTAMAFIDEPFAYSDGTKIKNFDRKFMGYITMRTALSYSRNIPALKAFKYNSNAEVKEFVTNLGLSPEISGGLVHEAHSIGGYNGESPLTMAAAYAAMGNGGYYIKPYSFTKIIYRESKEEFDNKPVKKRVMSEETAYMLADMLVTTSKVALRSYANVNGATFGAKTGTTNFDDKTIEAFKLPSNAINDYWTCGFSSEYSISIWYGYSKITTEYYNSTARRLDTKLFNTVAKGFFTKNSSFKKPAGVIEVSVEKETYPIMLPSSNTPANMIVTELFKKGTEPTEVSPRYARLDNVKNLTSEVTGNNVKLTWSTISTPASIDNDILAEYFDELYSDNSTRVSAFNARVAENANLFGSVTYNVYKKNSDGTLTLLATTSSNTYEAKINGTTEYVVAASYTVFKVAEASGTSVTVAYNNPSNNISALLNGMPNIQIKLNEGTYNEENVTVYEDTTDVTESATIVRTIKDEDNITYTKIDNDIEHTYTVTYNITYKSYSRTLERTVIVK